MAKAKLLFNLSDPDDLQEYKRAVKADDLARCLWEILRNSRKNIEEEFENQDNTHTNAFDGIERTFEYIWEIVEENGINIDELYN